MLLVRSEHARSWGASRGEKAYDLRVCGAALPQDEAQHHHRVRVGPRSCVAARCPRLPRVRIPAREPLRPSHRRRLPILLAVPSRLLCPAAAAVSGVVDLDAEVSTLRQPLGAEQRRLQRPARCRSLSPSGLRLARE